MPPVAEPIANAPPRLVPETVRPYAVIPAAAHQPVDELPQPPRTLPPVPDVELPRSLEEYDPVREQLRDQAAQIEQLRADLDSQQSSIEQVAENTDFLREENFLDAFSTVSRRVVNGRLHVDSWNFPQTSPGINTIENGNPAEDPQNRLLFRRIRFGVGGEVPPFNMSYQIDIEFSSQDGSQFRDAWIGWDDLVVFDTVRVGNQKRPYSLDQLNSSNFNVFLERPFVGDGFNEDNRRFGLMSYGVSDDRSFNWRYGVFDLTLVQDAGSIVNDNVQAEITGRLANTIWYDERSGGRGYAHWAIAGNVAFPDGEAPNNGSEDNEARFRSRPEGRSDRRWLSTDHIDGAETYELLALESVINVGAVQLVGEFMNVWLQRSSDEGRDLYLHGGYLYASYFLTGEHIPWNRRLGTIGRVEPFEDFFAVNDCNRRVGLGLGAWQVAARLSYANFNSDDVLGGIGPERNTRAKLALEFARQVATELSLRTCQRSPHHTDRWHTHRGLGRLPNLRHAVHDRLLSRRECRCRYCSARKGG